MKLNKKVIFGMVAGFFAVASVFNMGMLNENGAGDVSLDAIAVMAEAQSEAPKDSTKVGNWDWNEILDKWICSGTGNAC